LRARGFNDLHALEAQARVFQLKRQLIAKLFDQLGDFWPSSPNGQIHIEASDPRLDP
jgi:hypothetical protein